VFMYMCRGVCLQACPFIRPCLLDKIDNNTNTNTYWCYFSRIMVYNLVTIYGIATKFGIGMHPYPDFQCTKFQGNRIMHFCFITTFTPLRKEEKNEETKPIFEGLYLGNAWCNLVEI